MANVNIRSNSRIVAMMVLYNQDICKKFTGNGEMSLSNFDSLLDLIDTNTESSNSKVSEENDKPAYNKDFVYQLVNGVNVKLDDIDYELSVAIEKYTLDRLSYVDRNLLRIGAYEILYTDTPKNIVINEIINISKEYSELDDFKTSKFNNAILDKLNKK